MTSACLSKCDESPDTGVLAMAVPTDTTHSSTLLAISRRSPLRKRTIELACQFRSGEHGILHVVALTLGSLFVLTLTFVFVFLGRNHHAEKTALSK